MAISGSDSPAFADPQFDDSTWPSIAPAVDQRLSSLSIAPVARGIDWVRLHVHVENPGNALAVSLTVREPRTFAVFANGAKIGTAKGFNSGTDYNEQRFCVELPRISDIILAVEVKKPDGMDRFCPLERV